MEKKESTLEKNISTDVEDNKEVEQAISTVLERPATLRQQALAERIMENHGSMAQAIRDVGYSESTAKNPALVLKSKSFVELLEKRLPERHLLKKHREFLDSKKVIRVYIKGDLKEITEETDGNAVKALDMAYKLKGKYQEKAGNNVLVINVSAQSSDRYKPTVVPVETRSEGKTIDTSTHGK